MIRTSALAWLGFLSLCVTTFASDDARPLTRSEQTDYQETSRYEDVIAFLDKIATKDGPVVVTTIGESAQGKKMPLAIVSRPRVKDAAEARKSGKLIVYIQANIHGGEVEGKEAALMLLRDLSDKPENPLLEKLVLLVAPIYNIDGNEKWGDGARLRSSQNGPEKIGQRNNGQDLDLNRDGMKAETPETRAVLRHVYNAWDPEVMFDLHTTDGTRHGYELTYSPPLNPNTDAGILAYARDDLLPTVRAQLARDAKLKLFDYGNLQGRELKRGWYTFGEEGRYVTNYVGLRNRVAVLSEAASFLPFRVRVETTLAFVRGLLDELARKAESVREVTRAADARVKGWGENPAEAPALGVRFEMAARPTKELVPIEVTVPGKTVNRRKAPERFQDQELTVYDRFRVTRTASFPAAYVFPAALSNVAELLRRHGIVVERLKEPWNGEADEFLIEGLTPGRFERREMNRLEGRFTPDPKAAAPEGSYLVRTAQPLGILVFNLLEPESLDGVAAWGFLAGSIGEKTHYPILKVKRPVRTPAQLVP